MTSGQSRISIHPIRLPLVLLTGLAISGCADTREKDFSWVKVPEQVLATMPESPAPTPAPAAAQPQTAALPKALVEDFIRVANDRVYFESDRWALTGYAREILERQVDWLASHPGVKVRIEGNSDLRGDRDHNHMLSERRVAAVRDYLTSHGVLPSRITTASYGATQPLEAGRDPATLARNRNVRTVIVSAESR
jgi:peptidoglycan-associated lipoprotein